MLVSDPKIPLPAIASKRFMERTGLQAGGEAEFVLGNVLVPVTIRGTVDLFPTIVEPDRGFLLVNQDALYYYSALTLQSSGLYPNEGWVKLDSEDPAQRTKIINQLHDDYGIATANLVDRQTVLKSVQSDPIVRAGGSGILLLALVAAFSVLALGFALTLYLGGQGRSVEVSVMRAMGLSSRQVLIMIALEYLLVAVLGLMIGTIAGLRISDTMLSFLNVTQSGGRVVPPFSLATQWDTVAVAFIAAGIAFLVGVLGLVVYFLRLPVSRVLRLTR
jgi:putative ABC transport system permease protein